MGSQAQIAGSCRLAACLHGAVCWTSQELGRAEGINSGVGLLSCQQDVTIRPATLWHEVAVVWMLLIWGAIWEPWLHRVQLSVVKIHLSDIP